MKKSCIAAALTATLVLLSSCTGTTNKPDSTPDILSQSQSLSSESSSASVPAPAPAQSAITVDFALANEIVERQRVSYTDGLDAPGGMGEFYKSHPDFLHDKSYGRGQVNSGKPVEPVREYVRLLGLPQNDLLNRERLVLFVENYRNGIADSIVIHSSGDPIPLWLTVFSYDGNGTSYTVQSCYPFNDKLEWFDKYTSDQITETDTEWIMLDDPMQRITYPKYGYEPIPLGEVSGERTAEEAQAAVEKLYKTKHPLLDTTTAQDPQTIEDVPCYVFELQASEDSSSLEVFAVATDLSRYYQKEQVNGNWMLYTRMKVTP